MGRRPERPVFDTDTLALRDRFEAYRELYAPGADVQALGPHFRAALWTRTCGSIFLQRRSVYGVSHARDQGRVRRDAFDHFTLQAVLQGRLQIEMGTAETVCPGEIMLLDMTRWFRMVADAEIVTLSVPRQLVMETHANPGVLHGRHLSVAQAGPITRWMTARLQSPDASVLSLAHNEDFARALSASLGPPESPGRSRRDWDVMRRDRARRIVEDHLAEPASTPEEIATAAGMSRATLYRVFEPLGSIARWRQARRIWRFKTALAWSSLSIAEAAAQAGLTDAAYATALFNRTCGLTPSAYRQDLRRLQSEPDSVTELRWMLANVPVMHAHAG